MHSTKVLGLLLILSCNLLMVLGGQSVSLYSEKRFRGQPITVDLSTGGCHRLSSNVASINTAINCVRLYVGRNCFGTSFDVYRRCNIDLGRCNVSRKIESMSLC